MQEVVCEDITEDGWYNLESLVQDSVVLGEQIRFKLKVIILEAISDFSISLDPS